MKSFSRKLLNFLYMSSLLYTITVFFFFYPFYGLAFDLVVKGMAPAVVVVILIVFSVAAYVKKIATPLDNLKEGNQKDIETLFLIEKKLKKFFNYLYFACFPLISITAIIATLAADGFLRYSTIRLIIISMFVAPILGIIQLTALSFWFKDLKVKVNTFEFSYKKMGMSLKQSIIISLIVFGFTLSMSILFLTISREEKIAGISNVMFKIREVNPENANGYFSTLLELSQKSSDIQVKNEAERLIQTWPKQSVRNIYNHFIFWLVSFLFYSILVYLYANTLSSHIKTVIEKLHNMISAEGDLTSFVVKTKEDEIGEIQVCINQLISNLNKTFSTTFQTAKDIIEVTNRKQTNINYLMNSTNELQQMSNTLTELIWNQQRVSKVSGETVNDFLKSITANSSVIADQSAMIEQSSASINEMHASIKSVTEATDKAQKIGNELALTSDSSYKIIDEMNQIIKDISLKGKNINEVALTITKIAYQTNLLAMNAAIEAAHAGDAGRGFAVVADEIRNLAETTANSTKEIGVILKSTEESISKAVSKSNEVLNSITEIKDDVAQTKRIIEEVNQASKEQLIGANENLYAMNKLVDITQVVMKNLDKQSNATKQLSESAQILGKSSEQLSTIGSKQSSFNGTLITNLDEFKVYFTEINIKLNNLKEQFSSIKLQK